VFRLNLDAGTGRKTRFRGGGFKVGGNEQTATKWFLPTSPEERVKGKGTGKKKEKKKVKKKKNKKKRLVGGLRKSRGRKERRKKEKDKG